MSKKLEEEQPPGIRPLQRAIEVAEEHGISAMLFDEINAEIADARE